MMRQVGIERLVSFMVVIVMFRTMVTTKTLAVSPSDWSLWLMATCTHATRDTNDDWNSDCNGDGESRMA